MAAGERALWTQPILCCYRKPCADRQIAVRAVEMALRLRDLPQPWGAQPHCVCLTVTYGKPYAVGTPLGGSDAANQSAGRGSGVRPPAHPDGAHLPRPAPVPPQPDRRAKPPARGGGGAGAHQRVRRPVARAVQGANARRGRARVSVRAAAGRLDCIWSGGGGRRGRSRAERDDRDGLRGLGVCRALHGHARVEDRADGGGATAETAGVQLAKTAVRQRSGISPSIRSSTRPKRRSSCRCS